MSEHMPDNGDIQNPLASLKIETNIPLSLTILTLNLTWQKLLPAQPAHQKSAAPADIEGIVLLESYSRDEFYDCGKQACLPLIVSCLGEQNN